MEVSFPNKYCIYFLCFSLLSHIIFFLALCASSCLANEKNMDEPRPPSTSPCSAASLHLSMSWSQASAGEQWCRRTSVTVGRRAWRRGRTSTAVQVSKHADRQASAAMRATKKLLGTAACTTACGLHGSGGGGSLLHGGSAFATASAIATQPSRRPAWSCCNRSACCMDGRWPTASTVRPSQRRHAALSWAPPVDTTRFFSTGKLRFLAASFNE